jgi:hypothetical protein
MANEVHVQPAEETTTASMGGLLRGIINDVGDLIRQEIRFARTEIKSDAQKLLRAGAVLAFGVGTAALGVVLVAFMLVHLVHWLSSPAGTDPAGIPLWASYGIVAAVFLAIGSAMVFMGAKGFQNVNPLPDETAKNVKENVEWIMNSK